MGKVYSPEAVAAGQLPEAGAHQAAGRFILDALCKDEIDCMTTGESWPAISGAMIYGSTVVGTADVRSDVDVLFTYYSGHEARSLPYARHIFQEAEKRFNTSVETQAHVVGALFHPLEHTIDPAFAAHLCAVQEDPEWSRNWPVDGLSHNLSMDKDRLRTAAIRYCSGKRKKFATAQLEYRGSADLDVLQRAFELPNAIGRKVLSLNPEIALADPSRDKMGTIEKTANLMTRVSDMWHEGSDSAVRDYLRLVEMDMSYSRMLERAAAQKTPVDYYARWIENSYLEALRRAHNVSNFWTYNIEYQLDIRDQKAEIAARDALGIAEYDY